MNGVRRTVCGWSDPGRDPFSVMKGVRERPGLGSRVSGPGSGFTWGRREDRTGEDGVHLEEVVQNHEGVVGDSAPV